MAEESTTDRDLTQLAHRFIAETCDFLTESWNVQRQWWPLRTGSRGGACVSRCAAITNPNPAPEVRAAAAEALRAIRIVSLRLDQADAEEIGLADTHLFVLIPCSRWTGMRGAGIEAFIAQSPSDDEESWPIWVPETIAPPGTVRAPVPLSIAG